MKTRMPLSAWLVTVTIAGGMAFYVGGAIANQSGTMYPRTFITTEDSTGWDALRMGNRAGVVDGVLVVAVDDMPTDPYDRCMYLLAISERLGGLPYDTAMLCEPIGENR